MKKLLYSCRQGFKAFLLDRRKFYFTALEMCIAVILCNILLVSVFSLHMLKVQLQSDIDNSLIIIPGQITNKGEAISRARSKTVKPVSITEDDLKDIESYFGTRANPYYIVHWGISVKKDSEESKNILIFFTNALSEGECYLSESAKKVIDDRGYKVFAALSKDIMVPVIFEDLREGRFQPVSFDQRTIEGHLITNQINVATNDVIVFLPISTYFRNMQDIKIGSETIAIYFQNDYVSDGVYKTVQLLNQRHGDQFMYHYKTGYQDIKFQVRDLQVDIFTLSFLTCGVFLIIVLGMGGLVSALIKKREKEISIQLCLGVDISFLYFESLLKILLPTITAGVIGLVVSIPVVKAMQLEAAGSQWSLLSNIISFSVGCFVAASASLLPLLELRKIHPVQILRGEQ